MLTLVPLVLLAVPQEPVVLSRSERPLPELGITVREERTLDPRTRTVVRSLMDTNGNPVDGEALRRRAIELRDAKNGKLHASLVEKLEDGASHDVAFWLVQPAAAPALRAMLDDALHAGVPAEDARRIALEAAAASVGPGNTAFAAAAIAAGAKILHQDTITPIVFVHASPDVIRALAQRNDVDLAYWSSPTWEPEGEFGELDAAALAMFNDWASKTARTDAVHRRGITGAGVKVLVNDTGEVRTTNPYLPPIVTGGSLSVQAHATAVAGIICSDHVPHTGAAPGLTQLYSYGGSGDTNAPIAWAWGMNQGISFGNCSWWNGQKGQIQFLDRYFDYIIRNFAVMLFKSSGNQGTGDGKVTTPGNGYNMIASGNSDDRNNWDWNDDIMSSSSSWVNPIEGHDKPEVTACGTTITTTTTSSPWIGAQGTGTSYASPVTCGIAALLAETNTQLQAKPEAVRALLMAGAFHNIEGAAALSDRDGAGHVDAAASQSALAKGQLHAVTLTPASFTGGVYEVTIPLVANDETRICANWFSVANSSYSTDVLEMDLDMTVWLGSTLVASSASQFNPFEIVQFVPPATGNYTVRFQNQRFLGASEPFAMAWVTRRDAATNEVVLGGSPTLGGTVTFEFVDRYHPGAGYLAVLSLTPSPATMAVGPLKVLECGFDAATDLSLLLPGFGGTYDTTGRGFASLTIPNLPFLSGLTVYSAVISIDWSIAAIAEETSPTASFTIQ
jgi:hypothetical protein